MNVVLCRSSCCQKFVDDAAGVWMFWENLKLNYFKALWNFPELNIPLQQMRSGAGCLVTFAFHGCMKPGKFQKI